MTDTFQNRESLGSVRTKLNDNIGATNTLVIEVAGLDTRVDATELRLDGIDTSLAGIDDQFTTNETRSAGILRASVAVLLDDEELTYTSGQPGSVASGGIIQTAEEGFAYQVAAAGASNQHITTAGGVKLYVVQIGADVRAFGAVGDGVVDSTAAIQKMVTVFGYFTLPVGTFKITDEIVIPAGKYGVMFSGAGMEQSKIACSGMSGKKALRLATTTNYYRHTMRDFQISGDCDTCIDLTLISPYQVYQSEYRNLVLYSTGKSAFFASQHFSCSWYNVQVGSVSGHGFEIQGGNSTVMTNCYAQAFTAGNGKAGYRIYNGGTLVACNGINSGDYWGIFGATTASDGFNAQYLVTMIGCNVEDFGISAIRLYYQGTILCDRVDFVPKATGTYTTILDGSSFAGANGTVEMRHCRIVTKGSTRSGQSNILISNPTYVKSVGSAFPDYYNLNASLVYPSSQETLSAPFYQVSATRFNQLDAARYWGFASQEPATWTVNAVTMSLSGRNTIKTANTAATIMQTASGGVVGQRITIIIADANTTIQHNFASNGRFINKSGANYTAASGQVYEYVFNANNQWVEV